MEIKERILLMAEIAGKASGAGKTAMMKYMYLLQTLYHVPLEYEFEIYTYGPFCRTVMSDIEYAEFIDMLNISSVPYPTFTGYMIEETDAGKLQIKENEAYIEQFESAIDNMLSFFGHKTAKELELYSTIVFVAKADLEDRACIEKESICSTVKEIKPHFSDDTIQTAFEQLEQAGIFQQVAE